MQLRYQANTQNWQPFSTYALVPVITYPKAMKKMGTYDLRWVQVFSGQEMHVDKGTWDKGYADKGIWGHRDHKMWSVAKVDLHKM